MEKSKNVVVKTVIFALSALYGFINCVGLFFVGKKLNCVFLKKISIISPIVTFVLFVILGFVPDESSDMITIITTLICISIMIPSILILLNLKKYYNADGINGSISTDHDKIEYKFLNTDGVNPFFVKSFNVREHPIKNVNIKLKSQYFVCLTYLIDKTVGKSDSFSGNDKYIAECMELYRTELFSDISVSVADDEICEKYLSSFAKRWWKRKYLNVMLCDVALLVLEESLIRKASETIKRFLSEKQKGKFECVTDMLFENANIDEKYRNISLLVKQYRNNFEFLSYKEKKIIVTANMSAGKSTLINALIGKTLARTSQEVCTGNVCYFYNKAFEDNRIHLLTEELTMNATENELSNYDWSGKISIASYFKSNIPVVSRLCIIDTPGVDTALHREHSKLSHEALLNEKYDKIIYVVSPTRLGTEAEKKHLKWVAENLNKDNIIFVLNKLDAYHDFSDSLEESVQGFREDLVSCGFENAVICPISAYFAYLLKLKMIGQTLSEDEEDEYMFYSKKFMRDSYDLSHYYEGMKCSPDDSQETALSKRVGLYGLEKIIYDI